MSVYEGHDGEVWVNGQPLDPARHVRSYSPTGFDWGTRTAGAIQLAIAILTHAFGPSFALTYGARFKRDVVWHLRPAWVLTSEDLLEWKAGVTAPREVLALADSADLDSLQTCHRCRAYLQIDSGTVQHICPRCTDCELLSVVARGRDWRRARERQG